VGDGILCSASTILTRPGVSSPPILWSAGGVIGYGASATSIGDGGCSSMCAGFRSLADRSVPTLGTSVDACSEVTDPVSDATPGCESTGEGFDICARLSFSFLRYRSLSLRARSRSLLSPSIIARCLSTRRHS